MSKRFLNEKNTYLRYNSYRLDEYFAIELCVKNQK